ncbi:restriction endonuclease subunit S [Rhizobium arsenicireducens]
MNEPTDRQCNNAENKGFGELPEQWQHPPLWAVATCNDEVLGEGTDPEKEIVYLEISGVTAGVGITDVTEMTFSEAPSRARRKVQAGDVVVSTVRTYLRAIAPVVDPPENLIVSTGFAVLRPRTVTSEYLGYVVQAESFVSEVIARSVGVSYPAINSGDLVKIKIPYPPLAEQRAIASFLDRETAKIDALLEEQKRLINLLKEKRQALISTAVSGQIDVRSLAEVENTA